MSFTVPANPRSHGVKMTDRIKLCWRILRADPGNSMDHAMLELPPSENQTDRRMRQDLLEMVLVFGTQGHSGFSASYATSALEKLLRFQPLGPLTGEQTEWLEVGPGVFQNRRCGRVLKDASVFGGQAYDLNGRVFREPDGTCYTNSESRTPITFPYVPTTVYVDAPT